MCETEIRTIIEVEITRIREVEMTRIRGVEMTQTSGGIYKTDIVRSSLSRSIVIRIIKASYMIPK